MAKTGQSTDELISDEITFDDCCRLILEQGAPGRARAFADQLDNRRDLLLLLKKEFGIEWNDTDQTQRSRTVMDTDGRYWLDGVPHIAKDLIRDYSGISDPFSGYLEYSFAKGEIEVWKAHRAGIGDAVRRRS